MTSPDRNLEGRDCMRWKLPTTLCLLLFLAAAPLDGQATPEAAAEEYVAALRAGDWRRTATLMDPEALMELKSLFAAVAAADSAGEVTRLLFRVPDAVSFDRLSPAEVYARLLDRVTTATPAAQQAMRSMEAEVIGSVREGDSAHVVYRMTTTLGEVPLRKVDVLSFRLRGDRWMALLTSDLQGLAHTLARELDQH